MIKDLEERGEKMAENNKSLKGSLSKAEVRGILALGIVAGYIVGIFAGIVPPQDLPIIVGTVVGFYFGTKSTEKKE